MEGKIVNRFVCIWEPKSTGSADLFAFVRDKLNDNFLSNHMSKFVGFVHPLLEKKTSFWTKYHLVFLFQLLI
jgi:hypothetical protein